MNVRNRNWMETEKVNILSFCIEIIIVIVMFAPHAHFNQINRLIIFILSLFTKQKSNSTISLHPLIWKMQLKTSSPIGKFCVKITTSNNFAPQKQKQNSLIIKYKVHVHQSVRHHPLHLIHHIQSRVVDQKLKRLCTT